MKRADSPEPPLRTGSIAVGTLNPVKLEAVGGVLQELGYAAEPVGVPVPSGVPEQPWGDDQTLAGAQNRARGARDATGAEMGVGIESGVARVAGGLFAFTWVVVLRADGARGRGCSARLELAPGVARLLESGFDLETAMEKVHGVAGAGRAGGAMGLATRGQVTRGDAMRHAIHFALAALRAPR